MESNNKTKETAWQGIKFTLFSISAGLIQVASFALLKEFILRFDQSEYGINYFISLALSVIWNFTFNREFTFKSAANVPIAMLKVLGYYVVFTPASIWWGKALVDYAGWNEYLVLGITMAINFITEFLFTKYVVFRGQENTNNLAKKQAAKKAAKLQQNNQGNQDNHQDNNDENKNA